ncbi:hypothetical protein [Streptomyces sp. MMS24-I29]|uniref:hypothetical protein n=1 Tax=Streptomyces sp. MMS24-I29 TaxID=3351480 RepID=UPI003C7A0450
MTRRRVLSARMAAVVAFAYLALSMSACSVLTAGEVVDKEVQPSSSWVETVCRGYDQNGICSTWVPVTHYESAKWSLKLRQGERTGRVIVSTKEYKACRIGDSYPECARSKKKGAPR